MKTIPMPEIIDRLTVVSNCTPQKAEAFLNEFTALVTRVLAENGTLHVKGLGTFRRIDIADEPTVEFAPDSTLATEVNAPFTMFDPIELDDALTEDMLDTAANVTDDVIDTSPIETQNQKPDPSISQEIKEAEEAEATEEAEKPNTPPSNSHNNGDATMPQTDVEQNASRTGTPSDNNVVSTPPPTPRKPLEQVSREKIIEKERVVEVVSHRHNAMQLAITAIIALIAGFLIGYFVYERINLTHVKSVNISADDVQVYHQVTSVDTVSAPTATPITANPDTPGQEDIDAETKNDEPAEPAIVTDTVRANRFLTTMAKEHYSKKIFWVYIYEENRHKLDDPDRIAANTIVVIPPASKYGIKPGDPQSEANAELKAKEIMERSSK